MRVILALKPIKGLEPQITDSIQNKKVPQLSIVELFVSDYKLVGLEGLEPPTS